MIRNIIFDMGNVLARFDIPRFCDSSAKNDADSAVLQREVFQSVEWAQFDRGVITRDDVVRSISGRLPDRLRPQVQWLVERWYDHFEADPEMERFIGKLKQLGYGIYLLSNASVDFYAFRSSLKALRYFDGELVSSDVRLLKPDRQIFEALLAKYALKAEECFFVDDMFNNVEAALRLGFSGMVYRGSVQDLERELGKVIL
jgi:putative hydrolase of the HAD superfamily